MQTQYRREFHPAVSIFSLLVFVVAVESAATMRLPWLAVAALLLLARSEAWRRFVRLSWKARWLWLALFLLHAWTVPGVLVFPSDWSPTYEGLQAGLLRIARLLLLLAVLARLLVELSPQQLAAGIYLLSKPLGWLGLDRRALAVRLALTLEQMEQAPMQGNWLERLKSPPGHSDESAEMHLTVPHVSVADLGVMLAALALLGMVAR
jgi:energy-coupling factor transporter transmembrane protein EcfT